MGIMTKFPMFYASHPSSDVSSTDVENNENSTLALFLHVAFDFRVNGKICSGSDIVLL